MAATLHVDGLAQDADNSSGAIHHKDTVLSG